MEQDIKQEFDKIYKGMSEGFKRMDDRFDGIDKELNMVLEVSQRVSDTVEGRFNQIENQVEGIANQMTQVVTKTFLTDQLANFARTNNLRLREDGPEYNK